MCLPEGGPQTLIIGPSPAHDRAVQTQTHLCAGKHTQSLIKQRDPSTLTHVADVLGKMYTLVWTGGAGRPQKHANQRSFHHETMRLYGRWRARSLRIFADERSDTLMQRILMRAYHKYTHRHKRFLLRKQKGSPKSQSNLVSTWEPISKMHTLGPCRLCLRPCRLLKDSRQTADKCRASCVSVF